MTGVVDKPKLDLTAVNERLVDLDAERVVQWASETFGNGLVLSTSFGIQSAVMLHLVTRELPNIPVIWIDTGYLPPETYRYADELSECLQLNLHVYQSPISPARMEAIYGKLWERGTVDALNQYDRIRKVEPMQQALTDLGTTAWLAGLRRQQTESRQALGRVNLQDGRYKIYPIVNWSSKDVYYYIQNNDLPQHPLFEAGYSTVGDWHSSRPLGADDTHERDTRFQGLKQECGLHLPQSPGEAESLNSSLL
ncbi:phosphoadenosine phosphosulfate reductase, thioredoxin dependent [Rubidibacter lacunae KORDI 51-2]|uniref:Phosphoadenosine 5'-phosphosulfate reductase n=1 Tax=Rubidibacter lacunae KORDI 51-2 TaxID=582515 RepID=U5DMP5_9CHRO|nr:phosphoadenylyl-sulfate reductase [Rubidibacter lacunae]ERN40975.1 phosphoadenosine phosphosulfate reductase, thioredoxin dependent [Rubidibacter lacunae KORDI 51-2]